MKTITKTYKSNGKLLITGEYVVLDGAKALAIPTKYGQSLKVTPINQPKLIWHSYTNKNTVWFNTTITLNELEKYGIYNDNVLHTLVNILKVAKQLNANFLINNHGYKVEAHLEFPNNWGLGSSSTLINLIADWAKVDAYQLLKHTFGGSGYDIACASYNTPITYELTKNSRVIVPVNFNPTFKNHLYFVYLNTKQNSRDGIAKYKSLHKVSQATITEINSITNTIITCNSLLNFNELITKHETLISKLIEQKPIKQLLFPNFNGAIKSLGAWGGDFVLAASKTNPTGYFKSKGFKTVIPFSEMIL